MTTPLVMVTAYDVTSARVAEAAGVDLVLAGDTAAMTMLGHAGTEPVTLDEMLVLTKAVRRGLRTPLLVGDLPLGAYEPSDAVAVASAQRLVKEGGADAVKLEASVGRARAIARRGIRVMGHLGLTPQSQSALGGFKTQGRTAAAALQLLADARALEAAGCFALVLEAVPSVVATAITDRLTIPTIGIGAGAGTTGQVLVFNDLVGFTSGVSPRFVKRYANASGTARDGLAAFAADVRAGRFPAQA